MRQGGRRITGAQNVSRMCLVCGVENVAGLRGRFYELAEIAEQEGASATVGAEDAGDETEACGRELFAVFTPGEVHQSYPGRLHGGIASAILDETIGRAITMMHPGTWGVTAELTVRFRKPVPLDDEIRALARVTRDTRKLFEGTGEILLRDGSVAVEARGKYVKQDLEEIAPGGFDEAEWFADQRAHAHDLDLPSPDGS